MKNKPSNFAPLFIASTAIFFLGSAFKFVFGKKENNLAANAEDQAASKLQQPLETADVEKEDVEPEEDPVQSL